jgi:CsoR family transcriptional regulator, copper-sensing transcriptional repressor
VIVESRGVRQQEVLHRLQRAEEQVRSITHMVECDTPCADVLTQLTAVRTALGKVGLLTAESHMKAVITERADASGHEAAVHDLHLIFKLVTRQR